MDDEIIVRPKTNCILDGVSEVVSCDKYIEDPDRKCCFKCGWNPRVAKLRVDALYLKRRTSHA